MEGPAKGGMIGELQKQPVALAETDWDARQKTTSEQFVKDLKAATKPDEEELRKSMGVYDVLAGLQKTEIDSTLSAWGQAGAQDKTGDPLFAALASNNVTLTSSSPAHNTGTDLSATVPYGWSPVSPLGFPLALLSRSVLGKYDIGAFVYLPNGPGTFLGGSVTPGGMVTTK